MPATNNWQRFPRPHLSRRALLGTGATAGAAFWAACKGESKPAAVKPEAGAEELEGTFINTFYNPPNNLNWYLTGDGFANMVINHLYNNRLLTQDKEAKAAPHLAAKWEQPDPVTYIFELRRDAKWSDGTPITAKDVNFSLTTALDKRVGGAVRRGPLLPVKGAQEFNGGQTATVAGFEVVSDSTFKLITDKPAAPMLANLGWGYGGPVTYPFHAMGSISPSDLEKHAVVTDPAKVPVFAGPFKFVRWLPDQYIELDRYEGFFGGRPKAKKIFLKQGTQDVFLAAFEREEVDFLMVPPTEVERTRRIAHGTVIVDNYGVFQRFHFQHERPFLKDKRVRQAMWYALNREAMNKALYQGLATIFHGPFPDWHWAHNPSITKYDYNAQTAKQLLQAAGWDPNQKVVLRYPTGNKPRELSAPMIQQFFAEVGIKLELAVSDFAALNKDMTEGTFDTALVGGWSVIPDPDAMNFMLHSSLTGKGNPFNAIYYKNPKVDQLLEQGRVETDFDKRRKVYQEYEAVVNDDVPLIWLYTEPEIEVYNKKIRGVTQRSWEGTYWGLWRIIHELTGIRRS
jgi:peptide/nickel transport system substrate-binding protein